MSFLKNLFADKKPEEKISRAALNKILATLRDGAIVVAADTRVLSSNRAADEAFCRGCDGAAGEEKKSGALEGKRLSEIVRDLNLHEAFRGAIERNASSGVELEIPSLENRRYDVHVAPFELENERGAIGVFYDITEIARLERVRQEFLSNVSHELRTPLTSILAFVETLEDGALEDQENNRHFLSVIRKNASRMHRLVDDVLELSTIESGKIAIDKKAVDLHHLVEEIFTNLSSKAARRKIELINEIALGAKVFADRARLEQMLTNLIDNAVKFNSDAGTVRVSYSRRGEKDVIEIADAGEGIAHEHLERIFERFYRADRARSREIGGTGLGLAIVKHLARLHDGEVSARSTSGKGATFTLELPKQ
jgi:two-component system phosphate regulon sensor histidine kinase PhoR